jgi:hypothetical protein
VHELLGEVGEVPRAILIARDLYEDALAAYMNQQFEVAAARFRQVASLAPTDRAAPMMAARADALAAEPPAATWGGVYVMTSK